MQTLSDIRRMATEMFGSFASSFVRETYGAKFTEADVTIAAREIVESGKYYPGDAMRGEVEKYGAEQSFHMVFEADKAKRITAEFEQSILESGIQYPITLCKITATDIAAGYVPSYFPTGIRVCDGHHRLFVAYEHGMRVPVKFINASELRQNYHNSPDPLFTSLPSANR